MTSLSGSAKSKRGADNPLATISSSSGSDEDSARACKGKDPEGESTCLPQLVHPDCIAREVEQLSCTVDCNDKSHNRKEQKSCKNPKPKKQKADFIELTSNQSRGSKIAGEENIFKVPANPVAVNWVEEARQFRPKNRFLAKLMTNQNEGLSTHDPHLTSKPMRERSLPRSFWQQPNKPLHVSTSLFPVLPPINPEGRHHQHHHHHHHQRKKRTIRVSNIELLQKLFDVVDSSDETRHLSVGQKLPLGGKNPRDAGSGTQPNFEESPPFKLTNQDENPFGHDALIGGSKDPYLVDPVANRVLQKMSFRQKYSNFAPLRCQGAKEGLIYPENLGVKPKWVEGHSKAPLAFLQEQQRQMSKNTQMLSELVMHI